MPPPFQLLEDASGFFFVHIFSTVIQLGIPEALDKPKSVDETAEELKLNQEALHRFFRALCVADIVVKKDNKYSLTEKGNLLRRSNKEGFSNLVSMLGLYYNESFSLLPDVIKFGKCKLLPKYEGDFF